MVASDLSGDDFLLVFNSDLRSRSNRCRATGNESVPKTKTNDRIIFFFFNYNQHFGNFKPQQFPSAV